LAAVGREAHNQLVDHFRAKDKNEPNKLGGTRQHYWLGVASSVQNPVLENGDTQARVSITDPTIAQKVFGGVITAKRAKFLTIPNAGGLWENSGDVRARDGIEAVRDEGIDDGGFGGEIRGWPGGGGIRPESEREPEGRSDRVAGDDGWIAVCTGIGGARAERRRSAKCGGKPVKFQISNFKFQIAGPSRDSRGRASNFKRFQIGGGAMSQKRKSKR
jgi:hypothetical protein